MKPLYNACESRSFGLQVGLGIKESVEDYLEPTRPTFLGFLLMVFCI